MATKRTSSPYLAERPGSRRGGKSPSRSPGPGARKQQQQHHHKHKVQGYASEGVKNNDIFNLPGSDWQLLIGLTIIAAVVRLFRIGQPTSVVFDEVQYVYTLSTPYPSTS